MAETPSDSFQGLGLSAEDLRTLNPKWSDVMISDYLSRSGDLAVISESIDTVSGEIAAINELLTDHVDDKDNPHEVEFETEEDLAVDGSNSMLAAFHTKHGGMISQIPSSDGGTAFDFSSTEVWSFSDYKLYNFSDRFHIGASGGVDESWFADKVVLEGGLLESNVAAGSDGFTLDQPANIHLGGAVLKLRDAFGELLTFTRSVVFGAVIENPAFSGNSKLEFKINADDYFKFTALSDTVTMIPTSTATKSSFDTTQPIFDFRVSGTTSALQISTADFRSESNADLGTFLFPFADVYTDGIFFSQIVSGASAIGFSHKTGFNYTHIGAKIFSYENLSAEKISLELTAADEWTLNLDDGRFASNVADAANAVAFLSNSISAITTTSKGLALWQNNGVDRVLFDWSGGIKFQGSFSSPPVTVTGVSYTAADELFILVDDDTAGSAVTIDLPAAASSDGVVYHIKKMGTTANVIVDADGAELIDGATTATLTTQHESIMIACNGVSWSIH